MREKDVMSTITAYLEVAAIRAKYRNMLI